MSESLADRLTAYKEGFKKNVPVNIQESMEESARRLRESGILDAARKVGEYAPDFTLKNVFGTPVSLAELRKDSRVVLCFYRGGW